MGFAHPRKRIAQARQTARQPAPVDCPGYNDRMPAPPDLPELSADWFQLESDPAHVARERERARKLRGSAWWKRRLQRGICAYCEQPFPAKELTMDHVVPVARGGRSTKGNVVPCCKPCNNQKKLMTPAERLLLAERVARAENDESADDQ